MGRIGTVLQFVRRTLRGVAVSDTVADPGGGAIVTGHHFAPPGDDAQPLPGDYALLVRSDGSGREQTAGYIDPRNEQTAGPGERRLYSRDPETGARVAHVWARADGQIDVANALGSIVLQPDGGCVVTTPSGSLTVGADGSASITNASGSVVLAPGGTVTINGVAISPTGVVTLPGGAVLNDHTHAAGTYNIGGTPVTGVSGVNL